MGRKRLGRLAAAIGLALMMTATANLPAMLGGNWLNYSQEALAKSSGGRSRGGSFKKKSPSSRSKPSKTRTSGSTTRSKPASSQTKPKKSTSTNRPSSSKNTNGGSYRQSAPVIVPVPIAPYQRPANVQNNSASPSPVSSSTTSPGGNLFLTILGWMIGLIILGIVFLIIFTIVRAIMSPKAATLADRQPVSKQARLIRKELDNDIVTITKLQVALLAVAGQIQQALSDLVANSDLETDEGLTEQLKEAALILLRTPESWSHVLTSSQTMNTREQAERLFEQISIGERNKLSAETLTNIKGRVQRRAIEIDPNEAPASYIVVTLLAATAHDKPLFGEIYDETALENALKTLAALTSDYLLVFELIWSPQDKTDSLTYDELLTEYTDMRQIA